MIYELIAKAIEPMSKKIYRFNEENVDPHVVPTSLGEVNTLSDFFDALILEARHTLLAEKLDPLDIPDGVHKELNALIMSATLDISRISVHNLSNIARLLPFTCEYENRIMTVSIPISFVDVKVFTDYKINAGIVIISEGRIMGRVEDISLYLTFSFDFLHKKMIFREFGIPKLGHVAVVFKGEGLSKYLLNVLTPIVIMSFKNILLSVVKTKVSEQIEEGMGTVNHILRELDAAKEEGNRGRSSEVPTTSNPNCK